MTYLRNRFVQKLMLLGALAASATTIQAALPLCNQECNMVYNLCLRSLPMIWTPAQCLTNHTNCIIKCSVR